MDILAAWRLFNKYSEEGFEEISFEDATNMKEYSQAAHCFIFAPSANIIFDRYPAKYAIMMQFRFDGRLGFPGGMVKISEPNIVDGLNRELEEEINLDLSKHQVTYEDHLISHVHHARKLCLHFFKLSLTLQEFVELEHRTLSAVEYGNETLGLLRIPLFTMEDEKRGFPQFLQQKFAGNGRTQLIYTLLRLKMMTSSELLQALQTAIRVSS